MQIHIVRQNQTLQGIAAAYSISPSILVSTNQIPNPNDLVPGQTIVIPIIGQYYWVNQGDTLYSVARRFGISLQALIYSNRISPQMVLPIGFRLYIPPLPKTNAEINAYVEIPSAGLTDELGRSLREAGPHLTYLSVFSYRVNRDGSLTASNIANLTQIARGARASLVMVVTNIEQNGFSGDLGHMILANEQVQDTLLNNIISIANQVGYRDIHFDFEFLLPEDREAYNRFLRKATNLLHARGLMVSTALAPKISRTQRGQWYEAHDYRAHGQIVDFVVLMTYEWGYSGGPPMAVSPITEVRKVVDYALTEIPSSKIMLGQNLYGYDWTLPYEPGNPPARAISPQEAIRIAARENVSILYDQQAQAPHFRYTDNEGNQHQVWFEDARSIQAKFNLVKSKQLRGVSYWKLGLSFPQNWLLVEDRFDVVKR